MFGKSGNGESGVPILGGGTSSGGGGGGGGASSSTTPGSGGTTAPPGNLPPKAKLLAAADKVPVGGAAGFTDPFTGNPAYCLQPKSGHFQAFSAICTHQGCTVQYVQSADEFQCPCHGSRYSASTGAVLQGPAQLPLSPIGIDESGGNLYVLD
jgi:thiosulfate dehydrogenase [quinone] large subunit